MTLHLTSIIEPANHAVSNAEAWHCEIVERDSLGHVHRRVIREIRAAATRAALCDAIDAGKRRVNRISGGDVLAGSHYAAGWWYAARRLRPVLFRSELVSC